MNSYSLTVRTENAIPHDVLLEHIAVALNDFNYLGEYSVTMDSATEPRQHPFDGPEVFDDEKTEEYTGPRPGPNLADGGYTVPVGAPFVIAQKGDSIITLPDPYPMITRALDKLKGYKRG